MFICAEAGSNQIHEQVLRKSERLQLLHQAATLNIKYGLLLIGERTGSLIRGIWVHFSDDLIETYRSCMNDIHVKFFRFTTDALRGTNDAVSYIKENERKKKKRGNKQAEICVLSVLFIWI